MSDKIVSDAPLAPITHGRIWRLSLPIILSNFSVPLVGMVDTAVIGRTGDVVGIGAVAIGALVISFMFWPFGFLRMVTGGLAAQAFGRSTKAEFAGEPTLVFSRAALLAMLVGGLVLLTQWLLLPFAFWLLSVDATVTEAASRYSAIRIWTAPATLMSYAVVGWLVGMQRMGMVLALQLVLNGTNIALDILFVTRFGWGIEGVAYASVIAELLAALLGLVLVWSAYHHRKPTRQQLFEPKALRALMSANGNVLIRTVLLQLGFATIPKLSDQFGVVVLAANALLMHFFMIMGYALDGFAYTVEALTGEALGRKDGQRYRRAFWLTLFWCLVCAVGFGVLFFFFGERLLQEFTTDVETIETAMRYLPWMVIVSISTAFVVHIDGVFIGATRTAEMRNAMIASVLLLWVLVYPLMALFGNHGLWLGFVIFITVRTIALAFYVPRLFQAASGAS